MSKTKIKENPIVHEEKSIEEKLSSIARKITTIDEWKKYINSYADICCKRLAKLQASNKKNQELKNGKPIAVITAGQPGAGKTPLINMYREILKEQYGVDPVINNSDIYRFCVPESYRIAKDFPEHASKVTDPVVRAIRKYLMDESISQKQSIIIENTLGETSAVQRIKETGIYDFFVILLAVPREESLLSEFERYIKMKESCDVARLVSIKAHDDRYYALDDNINKLDNEGIRIIVHARGKTEDDLPEILFDSDTKEKNRFGNIQEATNFARKRLYDEKKAGYETRLENIRCKLEQFGMTEEERKEFEKLENVISSSIEKDKRGRDIND